MQKFTVLIGGVMFGLASLSIARGAVPLSGSVSGKAMHVTDDTAIYQHLSEIKVPKEARLSFDSDLDHLSDLQPRYREKLPALARDPRLQGAMQRISSQKYLYKGSPKPVAQP